jgi:hypothetical protein
LPSGEAVARHIGVAPLSADQIATASTGWHGETPLWYYILREADVCTGGHRLGPVGGRIVTEVLVGLNDADATSYRRSETEWRPQKTLSELTELLTEKFFLRISGHRKWTEGRSHEPRILFGL